MQGSSTASRVTMLWLLAGPLLAVVAYAAATWGGLARPAALTAGVTTLCAAWWISEPVPIPVTSLVPFAAFPLLGVIDHKTVAQAYGHTLILLLLGGFLLSTALERSGAHRRLALGMVRLFGGGHRRRLVLGFMVASAALSMWISNTATTLMLLPVAIALLEAEPSRDLDKPLLLGTAYAASIGGLGTPIGTPPNIIFMGAYEKVSGRPWTFLEWMAIGVPVVVLMVPLAWRYLVRDVVAGAVGSKLPPGGPWSKREKRVLTVFGMTALLWMTRGAPSGGWAGWLGVPAGDSTVALLAVVVMFVLPDGDGDRLLDWETAAKIPWGLLLLFGGGIAIAQAFETSGLSAAIADGLQGVTKLPPVVMIAGLCLAVTFLTEVTSNTATATLLMPVLGALGVAAGVDPALVMVPAALSASCAFMLPVATAPNAIVFGTQRIALRDMAREGVALNLAGVVVVTTVCYLLL